MSGSGKIIDFEEAVRRLSPKRKPGTDMKAVARVTAKRTVSVNQVQRALSEYPELDSLQEEGIEARHIVAWLERYPAMSLNEFIAILRYAVQRQKDGSGMKITDYLFQPLMPE